MPSATAGPEPARVRILDAAEVLFAERGFDATPTSRIAERAGVPKGLVHYYFARKPELLAALVERLPDEEFEPAEVAVRGDVPQSLDRLVAALDARHASSSVLSHLLWREADTHPAVRDALHARFDRLVGAVRDVLVAAREGDERGADAAAVLLASTISYRHSVARHAADDSICRLGMERELRFIADALAAGVG